MDRRFQQRHASNVHTRTCLSLDRVWDMSFKRGPKLSYAYIDTHGIGRRPTDLVSSYCLIYFEPTMCMQYCTSCFPFSSAIVEAPKICKREFSCPRNKFICTERNKGSVIITNGFLYFYIFHYNINNQTVSTFILIYVP